MRRLVLVCALFAAGCGTGRVESRLGAYFAGLHARDLFDGAVIVAEGDRIVFEHGYGLANVDRGVPFTVDTPSDSGSLAKNFTAELVLELEREGRLSLDERAQRLLPELPYPSMTLRHLITHRNGLPDYDWFDTHHPRDEVRTPESLLAALAEHEPPLAFQPGTAFEYSSLGYDFASLAAARAAGKPFADLVRERFFAPLELTSAFLRPGRLHEFPGVRTVGYRRKDGKLAPHEVFDYEAFHGGSNIYISARDLHRWNASFFTRPTPATPSPLSLGSWYHEGTEYSYAGHLQGFHNEVYRDLSTRRSIVYVSNSTLDPWLQHGIILSVKAILDGRDPELVSPLKTEAVLLEGTWTSGRGDAVTIARTGERLSVVVDGMRYRMVEVKPATYYVPGLDFMMGFADGALHVATNFRLMKLTRAS